MASLPLDAAPPRGSALSDPARAIGSPRIDALLFWGAPAVALVFVSLWVALASRLPGATGLRAVALLVGVNAVVTYAHLIAVVPRAYLNREVFAANRRRLTIVPIALIALLLLSPACLVVAAVVAVFWDVHHSAMQTFGLARIYDMKAGNDARTLRRVDLALNWALYVGPIGAGAALAVHVAHFHDFARIGWASLAGVPATVGGWGPAIRALSIAAWATVTLFAAVHYARAARAGYQLPAHKAALLGVTGAVSIAAWTFAPPFVAFAVVNLFHAMQYFTIVWLKEGGRIRAAAPLRGVATGAALAGFLALCLGFGLAYQGAVGARVLLAPFVACSLLHFWYDGFVWSVRRKQV